MSDVSNDLLSKDLKKDLKKDKEQSEFERLLDFDVRQHLQEREGSKGKMLDYLSWAVAWELVRKEDPKASFKFVQGPDQSPVFYIGDSGIVQTNVTYKGETIAMWLAVKAKGKPTATDVANTLMRCFVKNIAMFGIGLRVYQTDGMAEYQPTPFQVQKIKELTGQVYGNNFPQFNDDCYEWVGRRDVTNFKDFTCEEAEILIKCLEIRLEERKNAYTQQQAYAQQQAKQQQAPSQSAPSQSAPQQQAPQPQPQPTTSTPTPVILTNEQYQQICTLAKTIEQVQKGFTATLGGLIIKNFHQPQGDLKKISSAQADALIDYLNKRIASLAPQS